MICSELSKTLLESARGVMEEFGEVTLSATHIAIAAADFCKARYTGLPTYAEGKVGFEEERLRYLFGGLVRISSYFRVHLAAQKKRGATETEFSFAEAETLAGKHWDGVVSAEILFLAALTDLTPDYHINLTRPVTATTAEEILSEAEEHIYDYVCEQTEKLCLALRERAARARAVRDFRPAAKFAEPEEALEELCALADAKWSERELTLTLPRFFGKAALKLSVTSAEGIYYIHDNSCALRCLGRRIPDLRRRERILKRVCSKTRLQKGRLTGSFSSPFHLFEFLKEAVFVAFADLYAPWATAHLVPADGGDAPSLAERVDREALTALLREGMGIYYDERDGLCLRLLARCSYSTARTYIRIQTEEDGTLCLRDGRCGKFEGEILENLFWDHDSLSPYRKQVEALIAPFGGEVEERGVCLRASRREFGTAVARFFCMAALLSELGGKIRVKEGRK